MPPLLARAGTTTEFERAPGLLLGAESNAAYPVLSIELQPDDLVLFYTDGLLERRANPVLERLAMVMRRMSDVSSTPGSEPLRHLHDLLSQASADDDTCTLLVHVIA
jgi:serine phosphatase RsbU (regulator of sigma subunit)